MFAALIVAALPAPGLTAPVEVPFRIAEDAIVVDAVVNGKKISCMFDTGFSGAFVLTDTINIGKPTGRMRLRDFVGEFEAKTVKIETLKLGEMSLPSDDMEVVQQPMAHLSLSYNTHTDGIMGLQVVRHAVVEINLEKSRFIFHPSTTDITKRQPDNQKTFLARLLPLGHNSMEMEVTAANGAKMVLALDTGNAFYATTHRDVLERCGLWEPNKTPAFMRTAMVASGPVDSWYLALNDIKIFGVPVKQSVWSIIDLPSSSAEGDGTIGFGFLKNFNVTIDLDRRRVWLENFTGKVADEPKADVGLTVGYDPQVGRVRVWRVTPNSPAERAGLRAGDAVLSIGEKDLVGDLGFHELNALLAGPKGSKVKVAASRAGNLMRVELEREFLINGLSSRTDPRSDPASPR